MANSGSYRIQDIPPSPDPSRSKLYLNRTPGGFAVDPSENVGACAHDLARQRRGAMKMLAPQPISVQLFYPGKNEDGEPVARPRGEVRAVAEGVNARPGHRPGKWNAADGCILDSFLEGGRAWSDWPDDLIWKSLAEVAAGLGPHGNGVRELADSCAIAILARCGIKATAQTLPHPFVAAKPGRVSV